MRPVDAVTEPMLIVCENIKIVKSPNNPCSFIIHYAELDMQLEAENEQDLFNWMIKVSVFNLHFSVYHNCLAFNMLAFKKTS
jgi:hypothetical protein